MTLGPRLGHALLGVCAATVTAAAAPNADATPPKADPAFLGVMMDPAPRGGHCLVTQVTAGSAADDAGLQPYDRVLAIDGTNIPDCARLTQIITAHDQDDVVKLEVQRGLASEDAAAEAPPRRIVVSAKLTSRSQVLRRAYLGHPLSTQLVGTDAVHAVQPLDLAAHKGRAAIVGWFDPSCTATCASVFSRVATWTRGKRAVAYGVTYRIHQPMPREVDEARAMRERYRLEVSLAVVDDPRTLATTALGPSRPMIFDADRIMFMVLDASGVVSYVASIAPGADDLEAALDELYVAADHAHRR